MSRRSKFKLLVAVFILGSLFVILCEYAGVIAYKSNTDKYTVVEGNIGDIYRTGYRGMSKKVRVDVNYKNEQYTFLTKYSYGDYIDKNINIAFYSPNDTYCKRINFFINRQIIGGFAFLLMGVAMLISYKKIKYTI